MVSAGFLISARSRTETGLSEYYNVRLVFSALSESVYVNQHVLALYTSHTRAVLSDSFLFPLLMLL